MSAYAAQPKSKEEQCQDVDLRAEFGEPRGQGNMGWCYANAAADLLSHYYRDELQGRPVSAVYIALKFNYSFWGNLLREGGISILALQNAMQTGVCPQTLDLELFRFGPHLTLREKLNFILAVKDKIDAGREQEAVNDITKARDAKSILFRLSVKELVKIIKSTPKSNLWHELAERLCGTHKQYLKKPAKIKWHSTYTLSSDKRLIRKLNESLDRRNPVAIGYYASFFDYQSAPKSPDSRHESVVIGRKYVKKTGTCEYLVRNSYGPRCSGYKNDVLKTRCQAGNLWIPENVLAYYMFGVTYIESDK